MQGYVIDIENASLENQYFRRVLYTANNQQIVIMTLKPHEETGFETQKIDQFIRVESGEGKIILNETEYPLKDGFAALIPAGTEHNIMNTGPDPLKLYALYSPPTAEKKGAEDEMNDEFEFFNGFTAEK